MGTNRLELKRQELPHFISGQEVETHLKGLRESFEDTARRKYMDNPELLEEAVAGIQSGFRTAISCCGEEAIGWGWFQGAEIFGDRLVPHLADVIYRLNQKPIKPDAVFYSEKARFLFGTLCQLGCVEIREEKVYIRVSNGDVEVPLGATIKESTLNLIPQLLA